MELFGDPEGFARIGAGLKAFKLVWREVLMLAGDSMHQALATAIRAGQIMLVSWPWAGRRDYSRRWKCAMPRPVRIASATTTTGLVIGSTVMGTAIATTAAQLSRMANEAYSAKRSGSW
jgi:hypothetical protein